MDGDTCDCGFFMDGHIAAGSDAAIPVIFDVEVFEADVGTTSRAEGGTSFRWCLMFAFTFKALNVAWRYFVLKKSRVFSDFSNQC